MERDDAQALAFLALRARCSSVCFGPAAPVPFEFEWEELLRRVRAAGGEKVARKLEAVVAAAEAAWPCGDSISSGEAGPASSETPAPGFEKIGGGKNLAIVALGSPANDDGSPRPRLLHTLDSTVALARRHPDVPIFATGAGVATAVPEAAAMAEWLISSGVAPGRVFEERQAQDTVGNYRFLRPLLEERGSRPCCWSR